jgi:ubiquinone/menaquinone biosynthesis C-methylase UbiE
MKVLKKKIREFMARKVLYPLEQKCLGLEQKCAYLESKVKYLENKGLASGIVGNCGTKFDNLADSIKYWSTYNVTQNRIFMSAEESLEYLEYRNEQYPGYIQLMPQDGKDGLTILDYGCGPGNDLVGFMTKSMPKELIGMDVSLVSLEEARSRLQLHEAKATLIQITEKNQNNLPLDSDSIDYIHCSGVLMLVPDPLLLLKEFQRILKPNGQFRLMIYNRDSLWYHLYVAYIVQIEYRLYANLPVGEAFGKTTDGENCPLVKVWSPSEMIELAHSAGLECTFLGAAPSRWEMLIAPRRFEALTNSQLNREHRDFLKNIYTDKWGIPYRDGIVAGVDACFSGQKQFFGERK